MTSVRFSLLTGGWNDSLKRDRRVRQVIFPTGPSRCATVLNLHFVTANLEMLLFPCLFAFSGGVIDIEKAVVVFAPRVTGTVPLFLLRHSPPQHLVIDASDPTVCGEKRLTKVQKWYTIHLQKRGYGCVCGLGSSCGSS
jgi:hypothetical protein